MSLNSVSEQEEGVVEALFRKKRTPFLALIATMRLKQWTKNLLLFAALLFTIDKHHGLHDLFMAVAAFFIFSLLSSSGYLLNDSLDAASDRKHPTKRYRPIACGELSARAAQVIALLLSVGSISCSFLLGTRFAITAIAYLATTMLYSYSLKHIVILDLLALALGFVLRAVGGAYAIPVGISPWLVLCTLLLALFLGISKRRGELVAVSRGRKHGRPILSEYSSAMLDQMSTIVTSALLMSYALYTIQSDTAHAHNSMIITIPFVIYGIFRYLYLIHRFDLGEAPDEIFLKDKPLLINIALWVVATAIVFLHPWR